MKVQLVTPYRVSLLQRYGVTVRGNVTSVYPPLTKHAFITKPTDTHTHTLQNPHIQTYPHIKKQVKTTTVHVKINSVQDTHN